MSVGLGLRRSWALLVFGALLGCQPAAPTATSPGGGGASGSASGEAATVNEDMQGSVKLDGSSTVEPISSAVAEAFAEQYPGVSVKVGRSGTGGGFDAMSRGEIDISNASRPVKAEELEAAKKNEIELVELPIAYDGLTLVVHPDNKFVDALTLDEIKKIFVEPGAKSWSEVRDGWPAEEIKIYAPGTDSGTFDYFKEVVAGKTGNLRSDMSTSEDDNVLVTGVAGSPHAIGFFGVAYYEQNQGKLRAVSVVNPQTKEPVLPTAATIESGTYAPFSRPLFIYVKSSSLKRPEVRAFVNYYLEKGNAHIQRVGYVPLPAAITDVAKAHVKERVTGTRFIGEDGSKKSGSVQEIYVLPEAK